MDHREFRFFRGSFFIWSAAINLINHAKAYFIFTELIPDKIVRTLYIHFVRRFNIFNRQLV